MATSVASHMAPPRNVESSCCLINGGMPRITRSEFEAGKVGVQVVVGASSHLGQGELRGEYVKSQMYEVTKERRKEGRKAP